MSNPKLTDWIDWDVKPTIDGVYQRDYAEGAVIMFSKFQDGMWHVHSRTAEIAALCTSTSCYQYLPWRGLAEEPK